MTLRALRSLAIAATMLVASVAAHAQQTVKIAFIDPLSGPPTPSRPSRSRSSTRSRA